MDKLQYYINRHGYNHYDFCEKYCTEFESIKGRINDS